MAMAGRAPVYSSGLVSRVARISAVRDDDQQGRAGYEPGQAGGGVVAGSPGDRCRDEHDELHGGDQGGRGEVAEDDR
jgi:hypothetical protein